MLNAIYTALVTLNERPEFAWAYSKLFVPPYWEDCKLLTL